MDGFRSIGKCSKYQQIPSSQWPSSKTKRRDNLTTAGVILETYPDPVQSKVTKTLSKMYHNVLKFSFRSPNIVTLLAILVMLSSVNITLAATAESEKNQNSFSKESDGFSKENTDAKAGGGRSGKSLFFNNPLTDLYFNNQYQNEDLLGGNNEDYMDNTDDEMMSRARPSGSNKKKYENSPIYYIRIPPSPYVHVPGYGYVSETPSLKPPPQVVNEGGNKVSSDGYQNYMRPSQNTYQEPSPSQNYMTNLMGAMSNYMPAQNYMNYNPTPGASSYYSNFQNPTSNYQGDAYTPTGDLYPAHTFPLNNFNNGAHNKYQNSPVYNLPLQFLANGKPTNIYTMPNDIQTVPMKPTKPARPDSPIYHLDKGPYVFNGKPTDIVLLRDAYNAFYDDTLNNFYP